MDLEKEKEIIKFIALDERVLISMLGDYETKGASPVDQYRKGLEVLKNLKGDIHTQICMNSALRELHTKYAESKPILVVSALIDLIAPLVVGVTPALIAVILFKEGLPVFCEAYWGGEDGVAPPHG